MNNQKAIYQAKHAFNGNSSQSQLSFVAGARIVAAQNQLGQWWWGNCNGKVSILCCFLGHNELCVCVLGKGDICMVCIRYISIYIYYIYSGAC